MRLGATTQRSERGARRRAAHLGEGHRPDAREVEQRARRAAAERGPLEHALASAEHPCGRGHGEGASARLQQRQQAAQHLRLQHRLGTRAVAAQVGQRRRRRILEPRLLAALRLSLGPTRLEAGTHRLQRARAHDAPRATLVARQLGDRHHRPLLLRQAQPAVRTLRRSARRAARRRHARHEAPAQQARHACLDQRLRHRRVGGEHGDHEDLAVAPSAAPARERVAAALLEERVQLLRWRLGALRCALLLAVRKEQAVQQALPRCLHRVGGSGRRAAGLSGESQLCEGQERWLGPSLLQQVDALARRGRRLGASRRLLARAALGRRVHACSHRP